MKLAYYAVGSTVSAATVVTYAFNQRANFYSACVYLAQSNLSLIILINLILFVFGSFMFALQRLFFGHLRPIEVEQLYEKAWFAVTETCLAMTIFREEVGAWFLVMFVALLTGKVWGWIGEGRVEILEQQPPANPTLFHARLSASLALSLIYDIWVMVYTVKTVIQQARPNMMVMFLFEFAVLTTSSSSTALRYCISLIETRIQKQQTMERLAERRREIREERERILRERATAVENGTVSADEAPPALPSEDDVEEFDIEVPGWEAKGHWVLTLDLLTDLVKLGIYTGFFVILLMFYGLPIHIMRDLFLTARSFIKRMSAFWRYRRATADMNDRYADATAEDIANEDTCIICREEMRPWSGTNPADEGAPAANGGPRPRQPNANERTRPKKLPCGHILHLGCLKSWLERQQVCPTCRRGVMEPAAPANGAPRAAPGAVGQVAAPGQPPQQGGGAPAAAPAPAQNNGMRVLNFGPLRVGFGQPQDLLRGLNGGRAAQPNAAPNAPRVYGLELGFPRLQNQAQPGDAPPPSPNTVQAQLQQLEQQIVQQIQELQMDQHQLHLVQLLERELQRLRAAQQSVREGGPVSAPGSNSIPNIQNLPGIQNLLNNPEPRRTATVSRHGLRQNASVIPSGSSDLPEGVTIPEGWSLLPLQRLDGSQPPQAPNAAPMPPSIPAPPAGPSQNLAPTMNDVPMRLPPDSTPESVAQLINQERERAQASAQTTEGLARLDAQRGILHNLPSETRSLAERLLNAETNALRQRASAESLEAQIPTPPSLSNPETRRGSGESVHGAGNVTSAPTPAANTSLPNWGSSGSPTGIPGFGLPSSSNANTPNSFSSTTAQASSPNPDPGLPNWSASSPYVGGNSATGGESQILAQGQGPPTGTPGSAMYGASPALATPPEGFSGENVVQTPVVASDGWTDVGTSEQGGEPEDASESGRADKGKGRAPTIEDVEDDES